MRPTQTERRTLCPAGVGVQEERDTARGRVADAFRERERDSTMTVNEIKRDRHGYSRKKKDHAIFYRTTSKAASELGIK